MTTDRPTYRHVFAICRTCRLVHPTTQPCHHPRLTRDVPALPAWVVWAVFGLLGWGIFAGLVVVGKALARVFQGIGW